MMPVGAPRRMSGLDGWWQEVDVLYDHARLKGHCPLCGSVSWIWRGWLTCDGGGDCRAIAMLQDGRVFVPAAEPLCS